MTQTTLRIILGAYAVLFVGVATIWPFYALVGVLAGASILYFLYLLSLALPRPSKTNNQPTTEAKMAANFKAWHVTIQAVITCPENEIPHNGIDLTYCDEPVQIEDLECVRLVPEKPPAVDMTGPIVDAQSIEFRAADLEAAAHLRAKGFERVADMIENEPTRKRRRVEPRHNSIQGVAEAMATAYHLAETLEPSGGEE